MAVEPRIRHYRDELPNGLRVVTVEAPHLHSALLAVYVHAGSRHEPPAKMGVSHFLEHMFFRGSERFPDTVRMNASVEAAGGNLNGVTTREYACYDTPLHPDELAVGFEVLGDMLRAPRLEGVATERRIILEEMNDELDERGRDVDLDNLSKRLVFAGHGLGHKIAGTRATVKTITREDLAAWHREKYGARNMVLVCAGRVARARVKQLARKHFGALPPGRATRDVPPPRPDARHESRLHLTSFHHSPQTELRLNFRAPPEAHKDGPALRIARRVLDDGLSSRLPFELVEKRGLAYDVRAEIDSFADVALFELEGATSHTNVGAVMDTMGAVLAGLIANGPTDDELARAKRRHRIGLEFAVDACGDLANWFGRVELWRRPESLAELAARYDAVSAADVRRACAQVFRRRNLNLVVIGRGGRRAARELAERAAALPLL